VQGPCIVFLSFVPKPALGQPWPDGTNTLKASASASAIRGRLGAHSALPRMEMLLPRLSKRVGGIGKQNGVRFLTSESKVQTGTAYPRRAVVRIRNEL
jgi:hypothetical protein